jgi:hypothetical protein
MKNARRGRKTDAKKQKLKKLCRGEVSAGRGASGRDVLDTETSCPAIPALEEDSYDDEHVDELTAKQFKNAYFNPPPLRLNGSFRISSAAELLQD